MKTTLRTKTFPTRDMSQDVDEVHRVSVSIQYSDYSSGDDVPEPQSITETDHEDTDDDSDSLSSTTSSDFEETHNHARKHTTPLIEMKVHEIISKLNPTTDMEDKKEPILPIANLPQPQQPQARSRGLSTTEKKARLQEKWQSLVNRNRNTSVHASQQPLRSRSHCVQSASLNESTIDWNAIHAKKPNNMPSRGSISITYNIPKELTPQQLWKKKKEERERAQTRRNSKQKHIETERLQRQKEEEDNLDRLRIETEKMQSEIDRLQKLKEKQRLKQIETERLEKDKIEREFEAEKQRLKQIEKAQKKQEVRNAMVESLEKHFVYDNEYILNGKYILLYLQTKLRMNIDEESVLNSVLIEVFGDKVVSAWGYCVRLI